MSQNSLKYREIGERLKTFAGKKYGSIAGLERQMSLAQNSLSQYSSGRNRPGYELQMRLRELGCNIEWLMTGKTSVEYIEQEENASAKYWRERAEKAEGEMEAVQRSLPSEVIQVILQTAKKYDSNGGKIRSYCGVRERLGFCHNECLKYYICHRKAFRIVYSSQLDWWLHQNKTEN